MGKIVKHKVLILFFVMAGIAMAFQPNTDISLIKNIGKIYNEIDKNLKMYKKISVDDFENSTQGGRVTGYFNKCDLKKIVAEFYGETGKSVYNCYFKNNNVIFVFVKSTAYSQSIYDENTTSLTEISSEENSFYFKEDNLIKWIDEKKNTKHSKEELAMKKSEIIKNVNDFKNKLTNSM